VRGPCIRPLGPRQRRGGNYPDTGGVRGHRSRARIRDPERCDGMALAAPRFHDKVEIRVTLTTRCSRLPSTKLTRPTEYRHGVMAYPDDLPPCRSPLRNGAILQGPARAYPGRFSGHEAVPDRTARSLFQPRRHPAARKAGTRSRPAPVAGAFATTYPGGTKVVDGPSESYTVNLSDPVSFPPRQSARSWNEWCIPIPFVRSFTYQAGQNLAVWLEIGPLDTLEVDAIWDGQGSPVATATYPLYSSPVAGLAPMMGLVLQGTGSPTLSCYGTAEVGEIVLLHAQNFGTPGSSVAMLQVGIGLSSPILLPPGNCLLWPDPLKSIFSYPQWIPNSGSCLGSWTIPNDPSYMYQEVVAQVTQSDGSGYPQSTNGLLIRIGGRY
jgi:hypothetical protein